MDQKEFATRLVAEFARLGLSERDARVGADWNALQREEREWIAKSDAERHGWGEVN